MKTYSSRCVFLSLDLHVFYSTDSEVFLAEQEQRFSGPRGHGAGWMWCRVQHLWTTGKLPFGADPYPNASAR